MQIGYYLVGTWSGRRAEQSQSRGEAGGGGKESVGVVLIRYCG